MTQLTKLKSATTINDVATLLGFKTSALSYILYIKGDDKKYKIFDIPKRYGGMRQICAPLADLKLIQRRLSEILQNCIEEINKDNKREDRIAHGFKRKRSIITNAKEHRNQRYVFNVDLKDFFGTINFGRVRGFFIKDKNFLLHKDVATVIAQIACFENSLPQGSPCSPVISNLIGHVLDIHLVRLASSNGITYTRYADDLTFSTNKAYFPVNIAKHSLNKEHEWIPGKKLLNLVKKSGFELNSPKTRMQYRDSRQEVTGLVVNRKVNVRSEYRRTVRAMVHSLFTTGGFNFVRNVTDINGVSKPGKIAGSTNQLHGMLGFIDGVDRYNKQISLKTKDLKDKSTLTSKESMYRRFLLFKEFYNASAPVIICEGKTDNIYLLHAIRALANKYPELATTNADNTIKLKVRIYKYSGTSTGRILKLNGGTGDLGNFIRQYKKESARFIAPGKQHPIILLIDNDDGAKAIYNTVQNITGEKPTGSEKSIHITSNLYLVPTPLINDIDTSIEDLFDPKIKLTTISGKTFNQNNDMETTTEYGKVVFAHKVVSVQAASIDFSGFEAILSNVSDVVNMHSKRFPTFAIPPATP